MIGRDSRRTRFLLLVILSAGTLGSFLGKRSQNPCKGLPPATGLKNPGQVTGEVDRILQNNYKSSINKQPLTPANQGRSVVPH